ncbi:MAG: Arc family DNA-binding protein [Pseudomonas sp.]|nr:Arc family DNA-binding protein [Pseudomonas sp.]
MNTSDEAQTNLKIPKALKDKLKVAAKVSRRSMTAEIVARLEESLTGDIEPGELVPAYQALEIAESARTRLRSVIEARAVEAINKAMTAGRTMVAVKFYDLGLDAMTNEELIQVYGDLYTKLDAAGYHLENDGEEVLIVYFSKPEHLKNDQENRGEAFK